MLWSSILKPLYSGMIRCESVLAETPCPRPGRFTFRQLKWLGDGRDGEPHTFHGLHQLQAGLVQVHVEPEMLQDRCLHNGVPQPDCTQ